MVGTSSMSVCSTGSTARTAGKSGTNKNAARAKARRAHPRSRGAGARPSAMLGLVVALDVRNQSEIACPFDCRRQLPLMARAHAAQPARQNLAVVGDEAAKRTVVLVVHVANP